MTFSVLASDLRFPEGPVILDDGSVVVSEMAAGRLTRVVGDGVECFAEVGGGPNGLLPLNGDLLVCQNGGASWGTAPWPYDLPGAAVLFRPTGPGSHEVAPQLQRVGADGTVETLTHNYVAQDSSVRDLLRPSDICADGAGGFYVTDGGETRGRTRELTGLLHGTPDGALREIVYPLEMPNGLALAPDEKSLYVAETRTRRIWKYELDGPGQVASAQGFVTVPSGGPLNVGGADGICVDDSGCVVVATLGAGGISVFEPDGTLVLQIPTDDPMTTNVAIDKSRDRLLMTLASSGRLVAIERWSDVLAQAR